MGLLDLQIATQLRSFRLDLDLNCPTGVLALVGPSGAGKSTVLRVIAGLLKPDSGRVTLDDETWFDSARSVNLPPEQRTVGMVFQEYALFPHMSVAGNVGFGGKTRVNELLERLSIGHLADARVSEISGGERQRVALARALSCDPKVLLLDEPLAALDTHTRSQVRGELGPLLHELALPAVLVTHDFADAAALADDVAVLVDGELRQRGAPFDLTRDPADPFVASFTGASVLDVTVSAGNLVLGNGTTLRAPEDAISGPAVLAVYPWEVKLGARGIAATVSAVIPHGGAMRVENDLMRADVSPAAAAGVRPGDTVRLEVAADALRLYPRA
jgi:ABC-type sulfate/molybdate transport systems ATPase subunit